MRLSQETKMVYLLVPILLLHAAALPADTGSYSLLQIEDGDTLVIELGSRPARVQLLGIDAPEDIANPKLIKDAERTGISQDLLLDLGRQATRHLQLLIGSAAAVKVEGDLKSTDKYGRVPVVVTLPGEKISLNSSMVQQGYAIALGSSSIGNGDQSELLRLEEQARNNQTGLWQSNPELMQAWSSRSIGTRHDLQN